MSLHTLNKFRSLAPALIVCIFLSFNALAGEVLKFDSKSIVVEELDKKNRLAGIFKVKNPTKSPIKIEVSSNCSCTADISLSMPMILPGKECRISFSSSNFVGSLIVKYELKGETVKEILSYSYPKGIKIKAASAKLVPQSVCPFTGSKISASHKFKYKDSYIFTCCKPCLIKVIENPNKALDALNKRGFRQRNLLESISFINGL